MPVPVASVTGSRQRAPPLNIDRIRDNGTPGVRIATPELADYSPPTAMPSLRPATVLLVLSLACGDPPAAQYPTATETEQVEAPLGAGDVFELHVYYGNNELKATYHLGHAGAISVQYIGKVEAAGRRASDLEEHIRARLADGYLVEPIVSITLVEAASKRVSVFGQVQKAGTIPFIEGMTIVDAIAQSGGFTGMAKKNAVQVTRILDGKKVSFTLPVELIGEGKRPNFEVLAGDVIFVPERLF
jgi:protein involved in polysaccharide export with SLBB domain